MTTYREINAVIPKDAPKPTPQEMLAGARRLVSLLYRVAREEGCLIGKRSFVFKLTSGRRYSRHRDGVFYVNPEKGWVSLCHSLSHWATYKWYGEAHGPTHAYIEKVLVEYVAKNFLDGQLRKEPKPEVPAKLLRASRISERIKLWEAKAKRAERALAKLRRQARYYERQAQ